MCFALVQTRIAATRFVWTVVILNSSDTSGLLLMVEYLKLTVYINFVVNPPAYKPGIDLAIKIPVLTCTIELQGTVDRIDWTVILSGPWKHWNSCKKYKIVS